MLIYKIKIKICCEYNLKEKLPYVDIIIGTHNTNLLKEYLTRYNIERRRIFEVVEKPISTQVVNHTVRDDPDNAYVNIIYGCNKFCHLICFLLD